MQRLSRTAADLSRQLDQEPAPPAAHSSLAGVEELLRSAADGLPRLAGELVRHQEVSPRARERTALC